MTTKDGIERGTPSGLAANTSIEPPRLPILCVRSVQTIKGTRKAVFPLCILLHVIVLALGIAAQTVRGRELVFVFRFFSTTGRSWKLEEPTH